MKADFRMLPRIIELIELLSSDESTNPPFSINFVLHSRRDPVIRVELYSWREYGKGSSKYIMTTCDAYKGLSIGGVVYMSSKQIILKLEQMAESMLESEVAA